MKLFQSVQEFYQTMGIYPSQPNQNRSLNLRNLLILLSMISLIVCAMGYFILRAKTALELAETFYLSSTELACLINFIISFWKIDNIQMFSEKVEEFIQNGKTKFLMKIVSQFKCCL